MKDEIKEIIRLNCEEEIDVKYFAKDDSLVDTTMDYSQLLDYITNLQEEKDKYKNVIDKIKEKVDYYKSAKYGTYDSDDILADLNYIFLELLEEVE